MSFKFPTIKRKDQRVSCLAKDLPSFWWNDLVGKDEFGRGTFGSVFVARNTANGAGDTVFVKKADPGCLPFTKTIQLEISGINMKQVNAMLRETESL